MTAITAETILTDARIMAIVPTTDIARATAFYGGTLGLVDRGAPTPGPQVIYRCGGGTLLEVYERPVAGEAEHTLISWEVSDMRAAVDQLRNRGVRFEEYDLPEVRTVDGISATGDLREAWFRDPDGNTSCASIRTSSSHRMTSLWRAVCCRVVGALVVPEAPHDSAPGASEDAGCMGVTGG